MIAQMHQSYGAAALLVVADASSFVFAGTGLGDGETVHGLPGQVVVGNEFDDYEPRVSGPSNVRILAHSRVDSVSGRLHSDMSYCSHPGGGLRDRDQAVGAGALGWRAEPGRRPQLRPLTGKQVAVAMVPSVLRAFGARPTGKKHPLEANWRRFYRVNAVPITSVDVGGPTWSTRAGGRSTRLAASVVGSRMMPRRAVAQTACMQADGLYAVKSAWRSVWRT